MWAFTVEPMAEGALLLRWDPQNPAAAGQIWQLQQILSQCPWLEDVVAAPCSLALISDTGVNITEQFKRWLDDHPLTELPTPHCQHHQLQVCYHPSVAPDLAAVASACGLTEDQVIERHLNGHYQVAATGFRPGFAHLSGLDPSLQLARRQSPRLQVPAGSLAIAEHYSAIYPQTGPGGWHLIGASAEPLLQLDQDPPCRLQLGDKVQFIAIELSQYQQQVAAHV